MAVTPAIPTTSNRYYWPEFDAEFLRSLTEHAKNIEESRSRINGNRTTSDEPRSVSTSSGSVNTIDGSSTVGGGGSKGSKTYQSTIMHRQRYLRSHKFTKEEDTADDKNSRVDKRRTPMGSKLRDHKKKSISCHRIFYTLFKDLVGCMVIKVDDF